MIAALPFARLFTLVGYQQIWRITLTQARSVRAQGELERGEHTMKGPFKPSLVFHQIAVCFPSRRPPAVRFPKSWERARATSWPRARFIYMSAGQSQPPLATGLRGRRWEDCEGDEGVGEVSHMFGWAERSTTCKTALINHFERRDYDWLAVCLLSRRLVGEGVS